MDVFPESEIYWSAEDFQKSLNKKIPDVRSLNFEFELNQLFIQQRFLLPDLKMLQ